MHSGIEVMWLGKRFIVSKKTDKDVKRSVCLN